jgi:hypothetical protein
MWRLSLRAGLGVSQAGRDHTETTPGQRPHPLAALLAAWAGSLRREISGPLCLPGRDTRGGVGIARLVSRLRARLIPFAPRRLPALEVTRHLAHRLPFPVGGTSVMHFVTTATNEDLVVEQDVAVDVEAHAVLAMA